MNDCWQRLDIVYQPCWLTVSFQTLLSAHPAILSYFAFFFQDCPVLRRSRAFTRKNPLYQEMWSLVCFTLLGTATFCLTTWLSSTTFALNPSEQTASLAANLIHANNQYFSDTVTVLRVVQGVASWTTLCAVSASLELVVWALASSKCGSRVLTLLSLSPTTGFLGVSRLACSRITTPATLGCGILRYAHSRIRWLRNVTYYGAQGFPTNGLLCWRHCAFW